MIMFFSDEGTWVFFFEEDNSFAQDIPTHNQHIRPVEFSCIQEFAEAAVGTVNITCVIDRCASHQLTIPASS
jgi:hypothetical protein